MEWPALSPTSAETSSNDVCGDEIAAIRLRTLHVHKIVLKRKGIIPHITSNNLSTTKEFLI